MKVYKDINDLPHFKNAVITIGTFDGVHLGHAKVIRQLVEEAETVEGTAVLITFYPHPKLIIQNDQKPVFVLNNPEEKYALLHQQGIEHVVVVPFNREFSEKPADEYIREFLVEKFHPHTIIIGYDHKFGKDRKGDYRLLESASARYNFKVKEIPERILRNITISSTRIREALLIGDIAKANEFLGYNYQFSGIVVHGNKRGRTIGFPTANLQINTQDKLIPANGVYAVTVKLEDKLYKGMMNIGIRPTINSDVRTIEVNILDFDQDIYGRVLIVMMHQRLRGEIKFNSLDELKDQLVIDRMNTLKALELNS